MFWLAEVFNGRYSEQEMQRYEEWARQERAETVARAFAGAGRATQSAALAFWGRIQRERRRRAAVRELNVLSDRVLKDIGLVRGEIPSVVDDLLNGRQTTRALAQTGRSASRRTSQAKQSENAQTVDQWRRAA